MDDKTNIDLYYEEAKEQLKNILAYLELEEGKQNILTAEGNIAYGMVMQKSGNYHVALEYLEKAYYAMLSI